MAELSMLGAAPSPAGALCAARGDAGLVVICRVGAQLCALPTPQVLEIMRPLPAEPVAGMPPFVRGVCIYRGRVVPVVDAALLMGSSDPAAAERFVALRVEERAVALAVSSVVGLRSFSSLVLDELPPLLREARADLVTAIGVLDGALLVQLQSARLVPESLWSALAPAAP